MFVYVFPNIDTKLLEALAKKRRYQCSIRKYLPFWIIISGPRSLPQSTAGEKAEQWQEALGLLAELPMSPDAARRPMGGV